MEIDQAYIIPIDNLRALCTELTQGKFTYSLEYTNKEVTLTFNDKGAEDINSLAFTFPIVADLSLISKLLGKEALEAEYLACLHVYTGKQSRFGLKLEGDQVKRECLDDWFKFWLPLEALLFREISHNINTL